MSAKSKLCVAVVAAMLLANATMAQTVNKSAEPDADEYYETEELLTHGAFRFMLEQRLSKMPDRAEPLRMEQMLIVLNDGREIYRQKGWRWHLDDPSDPAVDITGDGIPDVLVIDDSGGSHDPWTFYIFELRDGLPVHEFSRIGFVQLDDTPALEISHRDANFEDWKAPGYHSAFPRVILRYRDGAYEAAPDLMRRPPPSPAEFDELVDNASTGDGWKMTTAPRNGERAWDIGHHFLRTVIDLIYQGHADLVRNFIDDAWPPAKPGKQEFIKELMECRIRESEYWPTVAAMNNLPADPPIGRCLRGDNEG